MPEFKNRVRHSLKVMMAKADMDAQELADKSGVSYDAILKYLRGGDRPAA